MYDGCRWLGRAPGGPLLLAIIGLLISSAAMAQQAPAPPGGPPPRRVLSPEARRQLETLLPGVRSKVDAVMQARSALDALVKEYAQNKAELEALARETGPLLKRQKAADALAQELLKGAVDAARSKEEGALGDALKKLETQGETVQPLSPQERQRLSQNIARVQAMAPQLEQLKKRVIEAQQRFQQVREEMMQP